MYYSLIPGTNQLIQKHSDQGEALFNRHGYLIKNPNHRHYYNALRSGGYGGGFFDDLLAVLGGVGRSGLFDKKSSTGSLFNRNPQLAALPNETGQSIAALGTGSLGSPATPTFATSIPGIGYDGICVDTENDPEEDSDNYNGPGTVRRKVWQFNELLSHLGGYGNTPPQPYPYYPGSPYPNWPYNNRYPYPALVPIGAGTWTPAMQAAANESYADRDAALGLNQSPVVLDHQDFVTTHLKGIAIAVVIIILVLYFKNR